MVFKIFNLMFLGCCQLVQVDCFGFWKGKLVKILIEGLFKFGGCNNMGCMMFLNCGGGYKWFYCFVDFKWCKWDVLVMVECFEYDLNWIVFIVLICYEDGELSYILVLQCFVVGDIVVVGENVDVKLGNVVLLLCILVGMIVYNIELKFGKGVQIVWFVGVFVQIVGCDQGYMMLCFMFGEQCWVFGICMVSIGVVFNLDYVNINFGKVGCFCWFGIKLYICGVVMNLIDYLYGGGEGWIFGGCYLVIFWGKLIKGKCMWKNKQIDKYIVCSCYVCKK